MYMMIRVIRPDGSNEAYAMAVGTEDDNFSALWAVGKRHIGGDCMLQVVEEQSALGHLQTTLCDEEGLLKALPINAGWQQLMPNSPHVMVGTVVVLEHLEFGQLVY